MTTPRTFGGILLAAGLLAGCSSSGTASDAPPRTRLVTHVGLYGGPMRPDGHMALSDSPVQGEQMIVVGPGGHRWQLRTDAGGSATFTLRPGRYRVGSPYCGGHRTVLVRAGRPMYVQIACDVP